MNPYIGSIIESATKLLIALVLTAITAYVIPWLKNTVVPWLKEKHLYDIIKKFVEAAEKLAQAGTIPKEEKKQYVIALLKAKGITVTPEIEANIEAAVQELDIATLQAITHIGAVFEELPVEQEQPEE